MQISAQYLSVRIISYYHSDCLQRHLFVSDDTSLLDTGQKENSTFTPDTGQPKNAAKSVSFRNDSKDESSGKSKTCFVPPKEKEKFKPINGGPDHPYVSDNTKEDKEPSFPFSPARKDKLATSKRNETSDERLNNLKSSPGVKQPGAINESHDEQSGQKPENSEDYLILDRKLRCENKDTELISKGTSDDRSSSNKNPSPNGKDKKPSLFEGGFRTSAIELVCEDNQASQYQSNEQMNSKSSPRKKDDYKPKVSKPSPTVDSKSGSTHRMSEKPLKKDGASLGSKNQDKLNPRSPTLKESKKSSKTQIDGSHELTPNDLVEVRNVCLQSKGSELNQNLSQISDPQVNHKTEKIPRGKVKKTYSPLHKTSYVATDEREVAKVGQDPSNGRKEAIPTQISYHKVIDQKAETSLPKVDEYKDTTQVDNADKSLEYSRNSSGEFGQHRTPKSSDCLVEKNPNETHKLVQNLGYDSNENIQSGDSKTYRGKHRHEKIGKETKSSESLRSKANRLPSDSGKPKIRGKKTRITSDNENIEDVIMVSNQDPKEISSDMLTNQSDKLANIKTPQESKKAASSPTVTNHNDPKKDNAIHKPASVGKPSLKPNNDSSNRSKKKAESTDTDKLTIGPNHPLPEQAKTAGKPNITEVKPEASQELIPVKEPVTDLPTDEDNHKKEASRENRGTQFQADKVKNLPDESADPDASEKMDFEIVDTVPDLKKIVSKKTRPKLLKKAESPKQKNPASPDKIHMSVILDPNSTPVINPKRKNRPIKSLEKDERCDEPNREKTETVDEIDPNLPNLATIDDADDPSLDSQTPKEKTSFVAPKSDSEVKSRKPNLVKERGTSPSKKVSFQNPLGEIKTIHTIESADENRNADDEAVTESIGANIEIPIRENLPKRSSPNQHRRVPKTKNRSSPSLKLPKKIKSICDDLTSNTDYKRKRPRSSSGDVADGSPSKSPSGDLAIVSPSRFSSSDAADVSRPRSGRIADAPSSDLVYDEPNNRIESISESNRNYQSLPIGNEGTSLDPTTDNDELNLEQMVEPVSVQGLHEESFLDATQEYESGDVADEDPSPDTSAVKAAKIDSETQEPTDQNTEYSECEFDLHESILELQDITDAEVRLLADITPDPDVDRDVGGTEDQTPIMHVKTPTESETSSSDVDVPFTIPEKKYGNAYSTLRVSLLEEESIQLKMNRMTISGSEFIKSIEELSEEIQTTIRRSSASPRIFREDYNFPLSPIPDRSKSYSPPKDHNILTVNYCFSPDNLTSIMSRSLEEFSFMEQLSILQNKDERKSEKRLAEKKATREGERDYANDNVAPRTSEVDTETNEKIDSKTPSTVNVNSKSIGRIKKQAVSRVDTRSNTTALKKIPKQALSRVDARSNTTALGKVPKRKGSPIIGLKKNRPKSPAGAKPRSNNALTLKFRDGEKKKITDNTNSSKKSSNLLKRSIKITSQSKVAAESSSQGQVRKDIKPRSSTVIKKSNIHAPTSSKNSNESKSLQMKPTFPRLTKPQPARSEASSSANTTISNSRHERIQRKVKPTSTPAIKKSPSNASISSKGSDGSEAKSPNLLRLRPNPVRSESQSSLNSLTSLRSNASSRNGRTSELRRTALIRSQSNSSMSSIGSNSKKIKDIKRQARSKIDTGLQRKTKIPSSSQESSPVSFTDGKSITIVDPEIIATDSLFTYDETTMNNSEVSCPTPNPLSTEFEEEQ